MTADVVERGYGEGLRQRTRRRVVAALLGAGVAAASAGGLWWTWHAMVGARPPGEVPLLKADGRPWKARPENPGGYQVPNQDMFFYEPNKGRIERLLPPPEEPLPRSALPAPPPAEPAPTPPQQPAVPEEATAPAPPPSATAEALPPPVPVPAPPPAAVAAPPPPAAAAPEPPKIGLRLQIASLRTPEAAQSEWERVKRLNPDLLGAFTLTVARHDDQRGTFYRVQVGPVADAAQAERICAELKRRNIGCNLVR